MCVLQPPPRKAQLLPQFRPEIILTDLYPPGMSGLDLTPKIKSDPAARDITVLALTAFAMQGGERKADAGCHGYTTTTN